MSNKEWPASDYAIGSFIQATVADTFLPLLDIKPDDAVLDIGCGNGSFSLKIIEKVPQGSFLGVDASENMLTLARETAKACQNADWQQADVLTLPFEGAFDYIVSFWCLQWAVDIKQAFVNITRALKQGGRFFTLFPTGDDPFMWTFNHVRDSGQFASLRAFKPPVDYSRLHQGIETLNVLPLKTVDIQRVDEALTLPSLDTFRKFVNGIAFFHGQLELEEIKRINEAMVQAYAEKVKEHYQGNCLFKFSVFVVTGEK
ncbi:class I SAM-dependent methyltransferase [Legionella erythra]|uniref:Putative methyltransferase n=1 Tax=Legionella erythra TaxID=448 RepID=A0A0W0TKF3_LEGER|nr:class I SAM-dependent methyltransferase [Legionella erythra]KTC96078.1 putative methyltransferase [Legionella erythra]